MVTTLADSSRDRTKITLSWLNYIKIMTVQKNAKGLLSSLLQNGNIFPLKKTF